jgi:uncharacterized protein (DUF1810 family)
MDYRGVDIRVLQDDALSYPSDLLVLKYAQASYGVDRLAVDIAGIDEENLPAVGDSFLVHKPSGLECRNLLFVGVESITSFGYRSIREFSRRALIRAARISQPVREISMTLHGTGFGLDETEAFESEIAGIVETLDSGEYPDGLLTVSIIETTKSRADRMREALMALLSSDESDREAQPYTIGAKSQTRRIDSVGYDSAARPHIFVAMPFAESFEDVFYFGIAAPVRAVGFLCEKSGEVAFTGDIIARIRERIASAAFVIADLSDANPNVYLEVGYAWGVKVPCILLCNRTTDLKFDLQGQRCLFYGSIKELEGSLSAELAALTNRRRNAKAADPYNLERFVSAQDLSGTYGQVVSELGAGQKTGHWMWFIFPQIAGLGHSSISQKFAISSLAEARAYVRHPVLGPRLIKCAQLVMGIKGRSADEIFGRIDAIKLQSSMTLFMNAAPDEPIFRAVLDKYCAGVPDQGTLGRL